MRSLLWTCVFLLLMGELFLTLILVIPFPRRLRNWIVVAVSKLELKKRLGAPIKALFVVLVLALADAVTFLAKIYGAKEQYDHDGKSDSLGLNNPLDRHLIKEKEYKAGRNMYLVGFALTLLFVIGRITELMQEHAELAGKIENLEMAVSIMHADNDKNGGSKNDVAIDGIEMKPIVLKKKD